MIGEQERKLDEGVLTRYMETFIGFGSCEAAFWFVGMEQGGGEDLAELGRRLDAWRALGLDEVADLPRYCELLGEKRWHGPKARIQPTLGKLVRVVLAAQGREASPTAVRSYQSRRLGCSGGDTLVAELFPLPSRSVEHWIYGDLSSIPCLKSRDSYLAELRPKRTALLRDHLDRYQPRAVVFLGWSYREAWSALLESDLEAFADPRPGLLFGHRGKTICIVCHHPASHGITNEYFSRIGSLLAPGQAEAE